SKELGINIEYVKPFFKGSQKGLSIAIQEEQNEPFKGNIEVRIKGIPNSNKQTEVFILPQQEKIININYSDIDVNPVFSYKTAIKIISNNGYQIKKNFLVNFLQAPKFKSPPFLTGNLSSWKNIPAITLKGKQWVVRGAPYYTGPQQTWGNLRYGWDEKYLYFACEVYYDVFSQPYTGYNTWAADSLQLAFNLDPYKKQQKTGNAVADTNSIKRYSEIDFALTKQGPQTCRTISFNPDKFPIGLISPDILKFTAKKENLKNGQTKVIYEAAIPWKLLGMQNPPKAGQVIGIAATMNYLSKQKKLIAIGIFKGIADSKNPDEFGLLYLGGTE
ncbi:MAG: hypothetical protein M1135_00940, partial [Candidatus Omnitrophica bacterium]|nr:hypothetical protein [Candidatus Omnitrophota bacterium]